MAESGEKGKKLPSLERGPDLSRILAFTDGVFAIAITLLVLQIEVPEGLTSNSGFLNQLDDMLPDFTAFAISFIVIGVFWINHHRLMRMVKEYDSLLIGLTMLYLGGIVLLPFSTQLIGEYGTDVTLSAVFYILNLALVALAQALMIRTIITHGLGDPDYGWDLESSFKSSLFMTGVFLATAPIALVIGAWTPVLWLILLRFDPFQRERDSRYKDG
ncbi:MAG: DUF1211 domain-containing protein [Solirubrobacterales bacterium]|nr:DUF1211 domain-containing protein [Solirubrobacterales bacterium]